MYLAQETILKFFSYSGIDGIRSIEHILRVELDLQHTDFTLPFGHDRRFRGCTSYVRSSAVKNQETAMMSFILLLNHL